jgi:antitoxin component YwqK of YwqJK toxin-antitoxin module
MDDQESQNGNRCDMSTSQPIKAKKVEIIDGYTIKYHANGKTQWSKGKIVDGQTDGYWEWYRPDGTLKRSGYFSMGEPVGEWTTYGSDGKVYKVTTK